MTQAIGPKVFGFVVAAAALGACSGTIDAPGAPGRGPAANNDDQTGGGGGPVLPSPDTGLQRLTRTEYNYTVRDLLGDTSQPANTLVDDPVFGGLDNNAALLAARQPDIDQYDRLSTDIVERAFARTSTRSKLLGWGGCGGTINRTCATAMIAGFARRAWRRPIEPDELTALGSALDVAAAQGDKVEDGVKVAFRMILMSPNFLFRVEVDPT